AVIGVSDVDRAKTFYEKLGDSMPISHKAMISVLFSSHHTIPNARSSLERGVTSPKHGAVKSLTLAVDDIDAARNDLIERGIKVSEIFHFAGGPFNDAIENARLSGATRKLVPTFRSRRSRIRMGTVTCSR